ncbi:MAG TPA: hypothetical protein PK548_03380, partial [Bacteroidales bacterium]|nr:hypothetical protein [Bacteroidales bacterium]
MKKIILQFFFLIIFFHVAPSFASLSTPTLSSPSNGSSNQNARITLSWNSVSNATNYEYKISTDAQMLNATTAIVSSSSATISNLFFSTTYYWQVRALKTSNPADSSAWSPIWNFTVSNGVISLSSPSNNAMNQNPNVTLSWNSMTGATYYDYELDTTPNFNSPHLLSGSRSSSYSSFSTSNLLFGKKYYWRVRARHTNDIADWSTTWNFTVRTGPITLSSPSNGSINQNINVTLSWNTVSGINYYDYQLDTTPNFNSPILISSYRTSSYSSWSTSNLFFGKTYYWRIRARHATDTMPWSATWSFTTRDTPPTLSSPSNNAMNQNPNVTLSWNSISGISYYDYVLDTTPNFNSPLLLAGSRSSSYSSFSTSNLLFGKTYYWRLRARSSNDTTAWSTTWKFTVRTGPVILSSPSNGAVNQNINVTLSWNSISGINYYDYQIDTTPNFNSPLLLSGSRSSSYSSFSTSNLLFGKTYYWRIRARHAADTMPWSATWSFTTRFTAPTLSSPTDNAINQNPNVTLSWNSISGINYYDYELDTTPYFNSPHLLSGSRSSSYSSFSTSNLLFGKTYYWRIRARSSSDTTAWSSTWKFTVRTGPVILSSPSNGAVNQNINVTLSWNSISGIDYYDYQIDTTPNFNSLLLLSGSRSSSYSSFSTSNLLFGKTYYWRIRARHATDTMPWSATWNFTTRLTAPTLSSPSDNAINQNPNVSLSWNSMNGVSYYDYELDTTPNFNSLLLLAGSRSSSYSYFITSNLLFGKTYYWRVRARSSSDITDWSTIWKFTVRTGPVILSSPSNGSVNQNINVTLSWNSIDGIDYYDYQLDTTPNFNSPLLLAGDRSSSYSYFITSNLLFGKTYYWRIRARHAADTMPWSATWNFTTRLTAPTLSSPSDNAINQNPNVTLSWNSMNGVSYYDYELDTTPNFNSPLLLAGSRSSSYSYFITSNLLFGKTYYWRVRARSSSDTTAWSTTWKFTVRTGPVTLSSPSNGAVNQNVNVTLSWNSISGIDYYDYQIDTTPNFNSPLLLAGTRPSSYSYFITSNLLFGKTYYWRIRARHAADTMPWSDTWNFSTLNRMTLSSPANGASNVATNPTLYWNSLSGVNYYDYQCDITPNFNSSLLISGSRSSSYTSYMLNNLTFGTVYYWRVRARHTADTTRWSDTWNFSTTYQLTTPPTLISPANQSQNIPCHIGTTLSWSSTAGATYYEIIYADNANFNNAISDTTTALSILTDSLLCTTTYYWKVRGGDNFGYSPWSDIWSFTTDSLATINPLAAPTLIAPANQSVNISWTGTTLQWNFVQFATQYEYQ